MGIIDRLLVAKAVAHGLGGEPISNYMKKEFRTVLPESSFYDVAGERSVKKCDGHTGRFLFLFFRILIIGILFIVMFEYALHRYCSSPQSAHCAGG